MIDLSRWLGFWVGCFLSAGCLEQPDMRRIIFDHLVNYRTNIEYIVVLK